MGDAADLAGVREWYAKQVTANARPQSPELTAAFATVPREKFVGPGPWDVFASGRFVVAPTRDPAVLYQDVLVRLKGEVNNGQPSLHAMCLAALEIRRGERAVHIGAGTGYYTAIIAELVGAAGEVHAYEIDADLAELAPVNLADRLNLVVHKRSAVGTPLPGADVMYVSAGATHPVASWLDAIHPAGQLISPLTADESGAMLMLTRRSPERFDAKFITAVAFINCSGARDANAADNLTMAFRRGAIANVRSLRRGTPPDDTCWLEGDGWWLSTT